MIFCDLHLFNLKELQSPEEYFRKYASNINYTFYLDEKISSLFIQHSALKYDCTKSKTRFLLWKSGPNYWRDYISCFLFVRRQGPEVVMLHGMINPAQLILVALFMGRLTKIIVQNHAEKPFTGLKQLLQKLADRYVSGYLFVSKEQASPWIEKGIIRKDKKIFEIMEGSTTFAMRDKMAAKLRLGYTNNNLLFVWVGRLDNNKDPLTVLKAFVEYFKEHPHSKLLMFYGTSELEEQVIEFVRSTNISSFVDLCGNIKHELLEEYYNAADYFILGSHYEGSGYALCEAMACGCIPIVTNIPSFKSMTDTGDCGYLFEPGNFNELLQVLNHLRLDDLELYKNKALKKFKNDLSFVAIASKMSEIVKELVQK